MRRKRMPSTIDPGIEGKASFLVYDDFEGKETPMLLERIKVNLPRLRVDFFDYGDAHEPQPLDGDAASYFTSA